MWAVPIVTIVAALFADNTEKPGSGSSHGSSRAHRTRRRAGEGGFYGYDPLSTTPLSRTQMASGAPVYGAGLEREASHRRLTPSFGSTREREWRRAHIPVFGAGLEREASYQAIQTFGACPGSLGASAYGLNDNYGGDPIIDEIRYLNDLVLSIIKQYVSAYQVVKIAKLLSINKHRDDLIKTGAHSDDDRVVALDDQARGLVNPSPKDDSKIQKIAWDRDDLLREAVSQGIQV